MNETRPKKEVEADYISDTEPPEYVKSRATSQILYSFFIRFAHANFKPCPECQDKIHRIIEEADDLYFGNKSYEPAIEIHRFWEIKEDTWADIERHPATKKDYIEVYGSEKGPRYWKEYQELLNTTEEP